MSDIGKTALVTGANQGIGKHVVGKLAAEGWTVFLGARDLAKGKAAAAEIDGNARAIQLDVTDAESVAAAADRIASEAGSLHLLINNAAVSTPARLSDMSADARRDVLRASAISLADLREIWETNVFAVVGVTQAMLPLLRKSPGARIVMVGSGLGSLTANSDPDYPFRGIFTPGYAGSKAALNVIALAFAIELEKEGIHVNIVSPGFTSTNINSHQGTETIEDGAREVVRVALLEGDTRSGAFTMWEDQTIPW